MVTSPDRARLPDRRPAETVKLAHEGQTVHATAGFCPATGAVREVFLRRGGPPGSELDRLLDDVGVLLSHLLQLGVAPADLARGVGRLGWYPGDRSQKSEVRDQKVAPASIVGRVADWLAHVAAEAKEQGSGIGDQNGHPPPIPDPCRLTSDPDDLADFKPGGTD